jgi:hypothetical protein
VFGNEKKALWEIKEAMAAYLETLRLRLHPTKCQVFRTSDGVDFLGYRLFPTHRLLRKATAPRFIRWLRRQSEQYAQGQVSLQQVHHSVQSWLGHACHADTYGLRKQILGRIVWRKTAPLGGNPQR